jgi:outer membrane protein assembly factor BamB
MKSRILALCAALFALVGPVQAADWLQFRGPGGLGTAPDKNLAIRWSESSNVVWKTELPGSGSSSPIVVGQKIFVTCYSGYGDYQGEGDMKDLKRSLVCLDRAGKILWQRDVPADLPEEPYRGYTANHGYASSTPASDGRHVFAFFGKSGVFAFDLDGKQVWRKSVGSAKHSWGSGTSPILYKDVVIVNAGVESGSLIALNKKDGSQAWAVKGMDYTWVTPLLVATGGKQELVVSIYQTVLGYDPDSGAELWKCDGISDYVCPSLIAHDDVVFVIGARRGAAMAVRAGGKGDVSATHVLWRLNKGSNVSSPVYHDGHLFWAHERQGVIYCVNADKGKLVYEERLTPASGLIYASPVVANGKLYFVSRTKGTYVLDAAPQFQLLAHNTLGDSTVFNASPAVSDGRMLLRSDRFLYCLGKQ